jgi:hypothetical protein
MDRAQNGSNSRERRHFSDPQVAIRNSRPQPLCSPPVCRAIVAPITARSVCQMVTLRVALDGSRHAANAAFVRGNDSLAAIHVGMRFAGLKPHQE